MARVGAAHKHWSRARGGKRHLRRTSARLHIYPIRLSQVPSSSGSSADGGGESDDSSGDGDDGDSDDSSGDEGEGGGGQANASGAGAQARSNRVAPFAPISQPILSVEAAEILEQALSPEIEQRMEQFLKP